MDFLQELFENGPLSWEDFVAAAGKFKIADLSTGQYVSKQKHEDELAAKDTVITNLQGDLSTRDADLESLRASLEDNSDIETLNATIQKLQGDYQAVQADFESRLSKQAYEFAVKEFANSKQFSSNAAKRDFINGLLAKDLKLEGDKILGAEDFVASYSAENEDAFIKEVEPSSQGQKLPQFGDPTPPQAEPEVNEFIKHFAFTQLHPAD